MDVKVGDKFGGLTVIEKNGADITCECECGNICVVKQYKLKAGKQRYCQKGCKAKAMKAITPLKGKKFGMLTVLEDYLKYNENTGKNIHWCHCICDCGRECDYYWYSLVCGNAYRCKYHREWHGMARTPFYSRYTNMIYRCENSKFTCYENYGGRGIKVCDRWKESFLNFKEDMYDSYLEHVNKYGLHDTTLDRIDVDGDYSPENCKWATQEEQQANKRETLRIKDKDGEELCFYHYCQKHNLPDTKIRYYMYTKHMSMYDTLRAVGDNNFIEE